MFRKTFFRGTPYFVKYVKDTWRHTIKIRLKKRGYKTKHMFNKIIDDKSMCVCVYIKKSNAKGKILSFSNYDVHIRDFFKICLHALNLVAANLQRGREKTHGKYQSELNLFSSQLGTYRIKQECSLKTTLLSL